MSFILSIDQGTTSTRVILFDKEATIICSSQRKHEQIVPQAGYLEHSAEEIFTKVQLCLSDVAQQMQRMHLSMNEVACCGITCQRETVVVWDKTTGVPYYNAIVWSDTRHEKDLDSIREDCKLLNIDLKEKTGLPLSTYFSGGKLRWLVENDEVVRQALENKQAIIGTVDSWLVFKLTQFSESGPIHATDVSNASRTLLFNIKTLQWDEELCSLFKVPIQQLPKIMPSSSADGYGEISLKYFKGVKITGVAGDQQASLFGNCCFNPNQSKCTFGTGAFLLTNVGSQLNYAKDGLLTTVAYQLTGQKAIYAHEANISCAGAALEWLVSLNIIQSIAQIDTVIDQTNTSDGVIFIPAFSGLFCPHWRPDARGVLLGLTQHTNSGNIAVAALEAIALQVQDILSIVRHNQNISLQQLIVDGGITSSRHFSRILSQICNITVLNRQMVEVTALGVALLAGLACNFYTDLSDIENSINNQIVKTNIQENEYTLKIKQNWKKHLPKSFDLAEK